MKSEEFVINKLKELKNQFPDVNLRYEHRENLLTHLVEVLPFETFENNHHYIVAEMAIQDEFEAIYGREEEILFISSDSLNEIRNENFKL